MNKIMNIMVLSVIILTSCSSLNRKNCGPNDAGTDKDCQDKNCDFSSTNTNSKYKSIQEINKLINAFENNDFFDEKNEEKDAENNNIINKQKVLIIGGAINGQNSTFGASLKPGSCNTNEAIQKALDAMFAKIKNAKKNPKEVIPVYCRIYDDKNFINTDFYSLDIVEGDLDRFEMSPFKYKNIFIGNIKLIHETNFSRCLSNQNYKFLGKGLVNCCDTKFDKIIYDSGVVDKTIDHLAYDYLKKSGYDYSDSDESNNDDNNNVDNFYDKNDSKVNNINDFDKLLANLPEGDNSVDENDNINDFDKVLANLPDGDEPDDDDDDELDDFLNNFFSCYQRKHIPLLKKYMGNKNCKVYISESDMNDLIGTLHTNLLYSFQDDYKSMKQQFFPKITGTLENIMKEANSYKAMAKEILKNYLKTLNKVNFGTIGYYEF